MFWAENLVLENEKESPSPSKMALWSGPKENSRIWCQEKIENLIGPCARRRKKILRISKTPQRR